VLDERRKEKGRKKKERKKGTHTVKSSKRRRIVKVSPERVLLRCKLAEDIQPQLAGPPIAASGATASSIAEGWAFSKRMGERVEG